MRGVRAAVEPLRQVGFATGCVGSTALIDALDRMSKEEREWQMGRLAYLKLVEGMLTPLREFIATPEQRDELDEAYGVGTAETIKKAINNVGNALWGD